MNVLSLWSRAPVYTPKASWFLSEIPSRLPSLQLRLTRGALICLLRPSGLAMHRDRAAALALIASPRAPFLRRLRLYRRQHLLPPTSAPTAA